MTPEGTEVEGLLGRKVGKLLERAYQGKNMVRQGRTQVYTLAPNLQTVWTRTILRLFPYLQIDGRGGFL